VDIAAMTSSDPLPDPFIGPRTRRLAPPDLSVSRSFEEQAAARVILDDTRSVPKDRRSAAASRAPLIPRGAAVTVCAKAERYTARSPLC
jgi:hypothetical protein